MTTSLGTIVVRLDAAHAPVTTANFLRYVDARKYDGIVFYRTVRPGNQSRHRPIEVIQGGLDLPDAAPYPFGKIPLESTAKTGRRFDDGEIGIARDKDPGTGGSEFFIAIGSTNRLLDADQSPDHYGYAAFGRVIRGMDVVRRIQHSPAKAQRLSPPIRILSTTRLAVNHVPATLALVRLRAGFAAAARQGRGHEERGCGSLRDRPGGTRCADCALRRADSASSDPRPGTGPSATPRYLR